MIENVIYKKCIYIFFRINAVTEYYQLFVLLINIFALHYQIVLHLPKKNYRKNLVTAVYMMFIVF